MKSKVQDTVVFVPEVTARQFAIKISKKDLLELTKAEHRRDSVISDFLHVRLEKLDGVTHVEYDGHFGNYVYLTIANNYDTEETMQAIRAIYEDCLKNAKCQNKREETCN